MVDVLEGRAREPTGPIKAPRTYPGPGRPGNSLLQQVLDAENTDPQLRPRLRPSHLASDALLRPLALLQTTSGQVSSPRSRFSSSVVEGSDNLGLDGPGIEIAADRFGGEGQERRRRRRREEGGSDGSSSGFDDVGRGSDIDSGSGGEGGASGEAWKIRGSDRWWVECGSGRGDNKVVRWEDREWWWVKVVQQRRGVAEEARPEDRAEPGKGSLGGSETGERNVAKRRHGRPCGQQSMDEINGHCPQGEKASRFGLCRCRRFRCSGLCDHWQQRPDPQSVSSHHSPSPFLFLVGSA